MKNALLTLLSGVIRDLTRNSEAFAQATDVEQAVAMRTTARILRAHAKTLDSEAARIETVSYQRRVTEHQQALVAQGGN